MSKQNSLKYNIFIFIYLSKIIVFFSYFFLSFNRTFFCILYLDIYIGNILSKKKAVHVMVSKKEGPGFCSILENVYTISVPQFPHIQKKIIITPFHKIIITANHHFSIYLKFLIKFLVQVIYQIIIIISIRKFTRGLY